MLCSLEDKPFPVFPEELQEHTFFEFGSIEEHFKYRDAVMKAYPHVTVKAGSGWTDMGQ